jgi:hypothetical protein
MRADIWKKVTKRITTIAHEINVVEDYRELLLSVVIRSIQLHNEKKQEGTSSILLPELWCIGFGGNKNQTTGIAAAWFLLQLAAYWLDKVEDHELDRTELLSINESTIANLTTGLIFLSQSILNRLETDDGIAATTAGDIRTAFSESILKVCGGQHIDLTRKPLALGDVWTSFEQKSGLFFALACYAGARLATDNRDDLNSCLEFGKNLGILYQVADEREELVIDMPELWLKSTVFSAFQKEVVQSGILLTDRFSDCEEKAFHSGLLIYLNLQCRSFWNSGLQAISRIKADLSTKSELSNLLSRAANMKV